MPWRGCLLCRTLLGSRQRRSRCSEPNIAVPLGVGHCRKFLLKTVSPYLRGRHVLPRGSDLTHHHHPQNLLPPYYVFEVVHIRLVEKYLFQGVISFVVPITINASTRIGSPPPPSPPNIIYPGPTPPPISVISQMKKSIASLTS